MENMENMAKTEKMKIQRIRKNSNNKENMENMESMENMAINVMEREREREEKAREEKERIRMELILYLLSMLPEKNNPLKLLREKFFGMVFPWAKSLLLTTRLIPKHIHLPLLQERISFNSQQMEKVTVMDWELTMWELSAETERTLKLSMETSKNQIWAKNGR